MSMGKEEQLNYSNAQFIPDVEEEKQTQDYSNATFVADETQPSIGSVDVKEEQSPSFMQTVSDIITSHARQENKLERARGEMLSSATVGVSETLATQPAGIVSSSVKVIGDLTDSKVLVDFGNEMDKKISDINEFLEKDWIDKGDNDIDPKIGYISRTIGAGAGNVLQMQGLSKSLGTGLTYALYTVPDASEVYLGYREGGYGKEEALTAGAVTSAAYFTLDRVFDGALLSKGMKNTAVGLWDVLKEGVAESSQEASKNLIMKIGPDKTRDLMSGVLESAIGGVAGGVAGGMSVSVGGIDYNPNTNYENAKKSALEAGATEQDINNAIKEIYNMVDEKPEIAPKYLSDIMEKNVASITDAIREVPATVAYQSVDDFYKTADEFIEKNKGTPEGEKVKQIKEELGYAYDETYKALKNLMTEQEANANAKLVQGHALFASREFGISPKKYMDTMFARVEQGEAERFLGKPTKKQSKPTSLLQFIINNGGIKDEGGELKAMDAIKGRPGLVNNKKGLALDRAREMAVEVGYLGTQAMLETGQDILQTTTTDDLLNAIRDELSGRKVYSEADIGKVLEIQEKEAEEDTGEYEAWLEDQLHYEGIDYSKMSFEEKQNAVKEIESKKRALEEENVREEFDIYEDDYIPFQSAFAGSRVDYDKPSLEAIGTGEGAQAHGYGLYYALNKDVAERYRDTFVWAEHREKSLFFDEEKLNEEYEKAINSNMYELGSVLEDLLIQHEETNVLKNEDGLYSKDAIDYYKKNIRNKVINKERVTGQVHEVDIPEMPVLLDEQKKFSEQSDFVKEKIKSLNNEALNDIIEGNPTGGDIYGELVNDINKKTGYKLEQKEAEKKSSELLNSSGIKGITYFGEQDGRCFVIFNPDDVKVVQKFYQGEKRPRGAYYNGIITLFKNANPSTFIHESMHFYNKELEKLSNTSAKAKSILNTLENFSENEFNKSYTVSPKGTGYAVYDKNNRVVYDNMGKNFLSAKDAKEYAKDEIISRGFEQYAREGKSPSKYLVKAFHSFMNWLKHIYKSAKSLGIELNDEVRNAYGELLGGQDLDYWMSQPTESIISEIQDVQKEKKEYLDEIINKAVSEKGTEISEGQRRGIKDIWVKSMIPLSTRAKRISPILQTKLRRFEYNLSTTMNKRYEQAKPFMEVWKNMSEEDTIAFDLALKNDYVEKQIEIVQKYNAVDKWLSVKEILSDIYKQATDLGFDLGYREDYFPRKVKDSLGLLGYLKGQKDWTRYQQALSEADPNNTFTIEEKADFINNYMRGFVKVDIMPSKYGSEKERSIQVVDNELNRYYAPSIDSLISYIEGMTSRIESAKFLGKDLENIEDSIGGFISYLEENNLIKQEQVEEVRDILRARFGQRGVSNKWLSTTRDLSYMYTMGGLNSAITQIEDLSVSMYKAGVWNTLTTVFGDKAIKKSDIGVENISQEFATAKGTSKWLNTMFKFTGLDFIDSLGKETLINAVVKKFQSMNKKNPNELRTYLEPIMEDKTSSVMNDIENGNLSDDLMYLAFSELSDVQPVSLSELPELYNVGGNLRILYMLKSFMVKRIDTFRSECFDKIKSKNREERISGLQNLFKLSVFMVMMGATKDWIIDLLYGRKTDFTERMVNQALGLFGVSKFHLYKAREEGLEGFSKEFLFPPLFSFVDDFSSDIQKILKGKREIKDMEVLKGIPFVGRFYYWWFGRGAEKQKKKRKR